MVYQVHYTDWLEIEYLGDKNESKVEFFNENFDSARTFVRIAVDSGTSIISIVYYITLTVMQSDVRAFEPKKRFAEHLFSDAEFLALPFDWLKKTRTKSESEIDQYMAHHYELKTRQVQQR